MKDSCGIVYCHFNKINGKRYIGKTIQSAERRWRNGEGYKSCTYFYHAIQKYGWNNFEHSILEEDVPIALISSREQYYISFYHTNDVKFGYNLTLGGEGTYGVVISEQTRKLISENNKKRGFKMVYNGIPFDNMKRLAEYLGYNYDTVRSWIIGRVLPPDWFAQAEIYLKGEKLKLPCLSDEEKNFIRSEKIKQYYKTHDRSGENSPSYKHGRKSRAYLEQQKQIRKQQGKGIKPIIQMDENNNIIAIFPNVRAVMRSIKCGSKGITDCCKGKSESFRGYKWKYQY